MIDESAAAVSSLQELLVQYAFVKTPDIDVANNFFNALFDAANIVVSASVSPRNSEDLLEQLQARSALLPMLKLAYSKDCEGIVDMTQNAKTESVLLNNKLIALNSYFNSTMGVDELNVKDVRSAHSVFMKIMNGK